MPANRFRFVDSHDTELIAEPRAGAGPAELHVVVEERQGEDASASLVEFSATDARRLGAYLVAWADTVEREA